MRRVRAGMEALCAAREVPAQHAPARWRDTAERGDAPLVAVRRQSARDAQR